MKILRLISRSCLILSSVLVLVSCINGKLQADEVFKTWGFNGAADGWLRQVLGLDASAAVSEVVTPIRHPFVLRDFKPILASDTTP